jgi:DNA-binding IclR family transcriptional regulator
MAKSDAEVGLIVRRVRTEESGPARSIELSPLIQELEVCRKRGYAVTHSVIVPEVTTVSSLLPNVSGQPQMALGLGTGLKRFSGGIDGVLEILSSGISELKAAVSESAEFRSHAAASIS